MNAYDSEVRAEKLYSAIELVRLGVSRAQAARTVGVSRMTLWRWLREAGVNPSPQPPSSVLQILGRVNNES